MAVQQLLDAADKAASAAIGVGAGTSVVASASTFYLTLTQWQIVGIVGGLAIGLLGIVLKAGIDLYLRRLELKLKYGKKKVEEEEGEIFHGTP